MSDINREGKMYKNLYAVQIKTLGMGADDEPISIDDTSNPGQGAAAHAALMAKEDVVVMMRHQQGTSIAVIPYHAIAFAQIDMSRTEVDKPEDSTCVQSESSDNPSESSGNPSQS